MIGEGRGGIPTRFADVARDRIAITTPVCLVNEDEVARFIEGEREHGTGLVVFDMVYHMGVQDEDKSRLMLPLLNASRRISDELGACVVLVGHPGHNGDRRFRGSSAMRGYFDAEYHMASGLFTCEKVKDGDGMSTAASLRQSYTIDYPYIDWEGGGSPFRSSADREERIREYVRNNPGMSANAVAEVLRSELDCSKTTIRNTVRNIKSESRT